MTKTLNCSLRSVRTSAAFATMMALSLACSGVETREDRSSADLNSNESFEPWDRPRIEFRRAVSAKVPGFRETVPIDWPVRAGWVTSSRGSFEGLQGPSLKMWLLVPIKVLGRGFESFRVRSSTPARSVPLQDSPFASTHAEGAAVEIETSDDRGEFELSWVDANEQSVRERLTFQVSHDQPKVLLDPGCAALGVRFDPPRTLPKDLYYVGLRCATDDKGRVWVSFFHSRDATLQVKSSFEGASYENGVLLYAAELNQGTKRIFIQSRATKVGSDVFVEQLPRVRRR